ncbi:hypothetical protein TSTA_075550 [Talaromyces stipitatus ATCC 10500]|uniref:Uncharacterized protein n=1 Tax=Talaromyces stipitatus (strain ATCC 10500 / CBS 375.48 / QM 6759 / NRRL 1006) TaxID=441959 RepID=B8LVQ3_TALSN|nr:uncharacterized protein TSTA_075550 [Talaromyces stipitatus ATCC 10500]EED24183.1 hypothetical protein TSTA_075550 [Talaromyces stipitatus ATCC 10500]
MASLKSKRESAPRNSFRASSAQRRVATDPVNPVRLRPLSLGASVITTNNIEESQDQQRRVIKQGAECDLDLFKGRMLYLKQDAIDIASIIPEEPQIEVNVIYFCQLGFNIPIPFDNIGRVTYTGSGGTWEQVFKDERMRELDEN